MYKRVSEGKGEKEVQSREICTGGRIEIASGAGAKLQHRSTIIMRGNKRKRQIREVKKERT